MFLFFPMPSGDQTTNLGIGSDRITTNVYAQTAGGPIASEGAQGPLSAHWAPWAELTSIVSLATANHGEFTRQMPTTMHNCV